MSLSRTSLSSLAALAVSLGSSALANPTTEPAEPKVGATQSRSVVSVSLSTGSTGREAKRVVYAPPPGWYVRSHRVIVSNRYGTANYTVNTIPANWEWRSDEQSASAAKASASGTVSSYKVSGGGQASTASSNATNEHATMNSSHHMLAVDVSVRGAGFLQSGSGIDLTVVAELVYLGK